MLGLFRTPRRALIVAHDLFMTAAAVIASFYIRFEAVGLLDRRHTLFTFLPAFVVYAGFVYFFFHLYELKWRFASLPDLMNILRAATVLAVSLLVFDYVLVAPNVLGEFFFGKITIALVLDTPDRLPERIAHRVSLFSLYPDQTTRPLAGIESNACPRACRRRRGAVAGDRERCRHQDLAGRHPLAVRCRSRTEHPRHSGARQVRCARPYCERSGAARRHHCARDLHAFGIRA